MKRYYPVLSEQFSDWLKEHINYEGRDEEEYANKIIYDLYKPTDYYRAIIDYISGMTDNFIEKIYKEIISF